MASLGTLTYLPESLGQYRRHDGSAMHTANNVRSKVRKRREQALKSMLEEFPQARALVRYALARFYISQLSGAMKQGRPLISLGAVFALLGLMPQTLEAVHDRRQGQNLLSGFEY
jgi:hypothetical protein